MTFKMASSMSPQCTPLKHAYDQCFNSWFEGYLQPAIGESANPFSAASSSLGASSSTSKNTKNGDRQAANSKEQERAYLKRKAEEFEEKCGKVWESYRTCIAVSLAHYSFPFSLITLILNSPTSQRMQ